MNKINVPTSQNYTIDLVNTSYDVEIHVDGRLFATLSDKKIENLNIHAIRHWVEKEYNVKKDVFETNNYKAPFLIDIEESWIAN